MYLKGEGILSTDLLDLSFAESCWEDLRGDFVSTDGGYVGWLQVDFWEGVVGDSGMSSMLDGVRC